MKADRRQKNGGNLLIEVVELPCVPTWASVGKKNERRVRVTDAREDVRRRLYIAHVIRTTTWCLKGVIDPRDT